MRLSEYRFLLVMAFLLFMSNSQIRPIFPLYAVDLGASLLELGLIATVSFVASVVTRIPFGIISDRVGRWPILYLAMLIQAIAIPLNAVVPGPTWLYLTQGLSAIAYSAVAPTAHALALSLAAASEERGRAFGTYQTVGVGSGQTLGLLLCTFLTLYLGFRQIFWIMAIVPFVGLIVIVLLRPDIEKSHSGQNKIEDKNDIVSSLRSMAKSRNMQVLTFTMPIHHFVALGIHGTLFAVYAKNGFLLSPSIISALFTIWSVLGNVARYPLGRLADKLGFKRVLIAGFLLMAVMFISLAVPHLGVFIVGSLLFGLAFSLKVVTQFPLIGDSVPAKDTAFATAVILMISDVGSSAGSVFAGAAAMSLSIPTIFLIAAVIMFAMTPFLLLLREKAKD